MKVSSIERILRGAALTHGVALNRHLTLAARARLRSRSGGLTAAALAALVVAGMLSASLVHEDVADATPQQAAAAPAAAHAGSTAAAKVATWHRSSNLLRNSKFVRGAAHWRSGPGTAMAVLTNKSGRHIARVSTEQGRADAVIWQRGDHIAPTRAGQRYEATLIVRSRKGRTPAALRLVERSGTRTVGLTRSAAQVGAQFHKIVVSYVAKKSGSTLSLRAKSADLGGRSALFVRSVSLVTFTRAGAGGGATNTERTGWRLDWSDEFDGKSVNARKWRVRDGDYLSYDLATIVKSNVSVADGVLSLRARREPAARGRSYTSAYMDTIGKASWTYGRFEMRAKLPLAKGSSKGLWPAFWLRPDDGGVGELDIMEAVGSERSASDLSHTIWYDYNGTHRRETEGYSVASSTTQWHTYAVDWDADEIRWYVDDKLTYTRNRSTTPWLARAFSRPFNIRLNLQVGGSWAGSPNSATDFSQTYDIDYVRVYQRP